MSITGGTRLGSYEVLALIGASGEVSTAVDTKLGRDLTHQIRPKRPLPW